MHIKINHETKHELQQIAQLKNISVEEATQLVLERYAQRTKNEIERAHKAADAARKW